jgi:hypothetical protein
MPRPALNPKRSRGCIERTASYGRRIGTAVHRASMGHVARSRLGAVGTNRVVAQRFSGLSAGPFGQAPRRRAPRRTRAKLHQNLVMATLSYDRERAAALVLWV